MKDLIKILLITLYNINKMFDIEIFDVILKGKII